jgi:hypothetical protein
MFYRQCAVIEVPVDKEMVGNPSNISAMFMKVV